MWLVAVSGFVYSGGLNTNEVAHALQYLDGDVWLCTEHVDFPWACEHAHHRHGGAMGHATGMGGGVGGDHRVYAVVGGGGLGFGRLAATPSFVAASHGCGGGVVHRVHGQQTHQQPCAAICC